jgi:hypothetical protein
MELHSWCLELPSKRITFFTKLTKIVDVIATLTDYSITVTIYDPLANLEAVQKNTN